MADRTSKALAATNLVVTICYVQSKTIQKKTKKQAKAPLQYFWAQALPV